MKRIRCVMRRETGSREWNAFETTDGSSPRRGDSRRSGRVRRSANHEMILSLKDDVDDEVLGDAMFKEAKPFEVKEALSILRRLSSSCEESESRSV